MKKNSVSTPCVVKCGQGSIARLPLHRNPGLEIVYVQRGRLDWVVEDRAETIEPGSVFFTFPWEEHGSRDEYEPGHHWHWVLLRTAPGAKPGRFRLAKELGFSDTEQRLIARTLEGAPRRGLRASPALAWVLPALISEVKDDRMMGATTVRALSRMLVIELVRAVERVRKEEPKAAAPAIPPADRLRTCLSEVERRCEEAWSLAGLSRMAGMSRTRFAEAVKLATGDTPMGYLRRVRVRRAQTLLTQTSADITAIAHAVGFATSQHFAREFKRFTTLTAGDYRRIHR
ncbi:MAG: helix-turn-helix domain-containing protein [Verrucomicrobiota bacterium]